MVELPQETVPSSTVTDVQSVPPLDISTLPSMDVNISGTVNVQEISPTGRQRLYGPAQPDAPASPPASPPTDEIYAVQTSPPQRVEVQEIIACNTTNNAKTFTLTANVLDAAHAFFSEYSVAANDTEIFNVMIPLSAGESLHAEQGTAGAITLTIIGEVNNV